MSWRAAGLSYNRYLTVCAEAARKAVKAAVAPKYEARNYLWYKKAEWKDGSAKKKVHVTTETGKLEHW